MTAEPAGQFLLYQTEDEKLKIEVRLEAETIWLSQQHMATLFQTSKQNVSLHLRNIFAEGKLREDSVVKESLTTATDGKSYRTKLYSLDAIICAGYRVKSAIATRFRIWATQKLREYIVKGFVLDDERLKNPDQPFDYFDELLSGFKISARPSASFIKELQTSTPPASIRPNPTGEYRFFKTVQNKMHLAVTGQTAAEIIQSRADSKQPNMGLTNWRGAKVRKQDVSIAKNYLSEEELASLNNLVEQYLIFAEGQAMRKVPMHMRDWIAKLHGFLALNDRAVLTHAGKVSHDLAKDLAEAEYDKSHAARIQKADLTDNDFDKAIKQLPQAKPRRRGVKS